MRFSIRGSIIFFLIPLLFATQTVQAAISITVTGAWVETIDKNDLSAGAGSDLQSTYTSVSGQVSIDISGTGGASDAWRIDVRKIDSSWNSSLHPYVMRTSAGTGGSVNGGASYQEVTDINTSFFSGSGDVTGSASRGSRTTGWRRGGRCCVRRPRPIPSICRSSG
jgi:hypothetical protein